jgi:hypothetical protein
MIEMRMCDYNSIDGFGIDRKPIPVAQSLLLGTLKQSAIYQHPRFSSRQQKFASGDRPRPTHKPQGRDYRIADSVSHKPDVPLAAVKALLTGFVEDSLPETVSRSSAFTETKKGHIARY